MPRQSPHRVVLSPRVREELMERARAYTLPYFVVVRARMILMAAEGMTNDEIALRLSTRREVVSEWRSRFVKEGVKGLSSRARPGRPRLHPRSPPT